MDFVLQGLWRRVPLDICTLRLTAVYGPGRQTEFNVDTIVRAAERQWERHRKLAVPTFWLWLYVSATGVIVYWMLYHLAPRMAAQS